VHLTINGLAAREVSLVF